MPFDVFRPVNAWQQFAEPRWMPASFVNFLSTLGVSDVKKNTKNCENYLILIKNL